MQSRRPSRSFVRRRKQALDGEDLIGARRRSGVATRERGPRSGGDFLPFSKHFFGFPMRG